MFSAIKIAKEEEEIPLWQSHLANGSHRDYLFIEKNKFINRNSFPIIEYGTSIPLGSTDSVAAAASAHLTPPSNSGPQSVGRSVKALAPHSPYFLQSGGIAWKAAGLVTFFFAEIPLQSCPHPITVGGGGGGGGEAIFAHTLFWQ